MSANDAPDDAYPNITWQPARVTRATREAALGQRGAVVWLTGLSGAGKTTIAQGVDETLLARGLRSFVLDAENCRHHLCRDLGFSREDRAENVRRVGEAAALLAEAGVIVLVACISPLRAMRAALRERMPDDFIEVWVATPLATCERRDPKGLYRKARAGEIANFTGLDAPYEPPERPELTLNARQAPVEDAVRAVVGYLEAAGLIAAPETPDGA